jgi:hypothetical protein
VGKAFRQRWIRPGVHDPVKSFGIMPINAGSMGSKTEGSCVAENRHGDRAWNGLNKSTSTFTGGGRGGISDAILIGVTDVETTAAQITTSEMAGTTT